MQGWPKEWHREAAREDDMVKVAALRVFFSWGFSVNTLHLIAHWVLLLFALSYSDLLQHNRF